MTTLGFIIFGIIFSLVVIGLGLYYKEDDEPEVNLTMGFAIVAMIGLYWWAGSFYFF